MITVEWRLNWSFLLKVDWLIVIIASGDGLELNRRQAVTWSHWWPWSYDVIWPQCINPLRPRQNGRHFPDDTLNCIFLNENVRISIKISLKFAPKGPINNIPALVQIMAWRRPGDKPLSEPMMVSLLTHICVTRPQWVNKQDVCTVKDGLSDFMTIDGVYLRYNETYSESTHWGLKEMANFLQMTFFECIFLIENDHSLIEIYLKFVVKGPVDKEVIIGSGDGLALKRQVSISWTKNDHDHWFHMT